MEADDAVEGRTSHSFYFYMGQILWFLDISVFIPVIYVVLKTGSV